VELEKIDPEIAVPACKAALAADPNNPRLLFQMGRAFDAGKDKTSAKTFYERGAAQGHAGAQNNLALFHQYGVGGLSKDDLQAARLFKLAADSGEAKAQYSLGTFYEAGRGGLAKSEPDAVRLYKLSAGQGEALAQNRLGFFYAYGRGGLSKNEREAARLCKLSETPNQKAISTDLLQREVAALRARLTNCWYLPPGANSNTKIIVVLRVLLNRDGSLKQDPRVVEIKPPSPSPLSDALASSALQAMRLAQPFTMLQRENYDQWREIDIAFDPRMLAP
jgi:hypothetical protein